MEGMTSITTAQLRAAVNAWELDVRADRDAFEQDSEARALPLAKQVDGVVATILGYAAGFKADGSPLEG
jgi:CHASE1-domain containing sensor protein